MFGTGVKVLLPTGLGAEPAKGVADILGDEGRERRGIYMHINPPGRVAALVTSAGVEIEILEPGNLNELVDLG